jgi:alkanesulfonate monooxygenase SsuD/methylene tetrahydromethanopterin reductase-like flavin-dependent oxidoreductase (luciferase family)
MELSLYLYPVASDQTGLRGLWDRFGQQGDAASAARWRGIWTPEHHVARAYFPPPLQLLTWFAARYPSMSMGTAVALVPLYHPLQLAEALVAVDAVASDTQFGFGTGFRRREFTSVGADIEQKTAQTHELIEICRALLRGEQVSFDVGPWVGAEAQLPFPIDSGPTFLAAARTPGEVRKFADVADGVIPSPMSGFDGQIALLELMDELLGQPAKVRPVIADVVFGETEAIARARAVKRLGAEYASFKHQKSKVPDIATFSDDPEKNLDSIARYAIVGDASLIREKLDELAQHGVTDLLVRAEQAETSQGEVLEAIEALGDIWPSATKK